MGRGASTAPRPIFRPGDRMTANRRRKLTGLLYVAPAVIFVLVFVAYPLAQMRANRV